MSSPQLPDFFMQFQDIESILDDLRNSDKNVRAKATDQLIKTGTRAVPYLLPLLDDEDWVIRYRSLEALSGIRDTGTIDAIIKKTDDPKDHVRYMAAKALCAMNDERVINVLAKMLSDDHSYTRKIAAGGIAVSGDSSSETLLQNALIKETEPDVRACLEDALCRIKK